MAEDEVLAGFVVVERPREEVLSSSLEEDEYQTTSRFLFFRFVLSAGSSDLRFLSGVSDGSSGVWPFSRGRGVEVAAEAGDGAAKGEEPDGD
jgi:hypothetical protein